VNTQPPGVERPITVASVLQDQRLRIALTYFVALQLLDTVTTVIGLVSGLTELNPITTGVVHDFGAFGLLLQKVPAVIVGLLGATLLPRRAALAVVWGLSGLMALVLASNVALVFAAR